MHHKITMLIFLQHYVISKVEAKFSPTLHMSCLERFFLKKSRGVISRSGYSGYSGYRHFFSGVAHAYQFCNHFCKNDRKKWLQLVTSGVKCNHFFEKNVKKRPIFSIL